MQHDRGTGSYAALMLSVLLLAACKGEPVRPPAGNFQAAPGAARASSSSERSSAREEAPNLFEAAKLNVSLGQAYLAKGQLELAMEKLKKAVALNPKSPDAHTLLAVLYEQINNDALAEDHYVKAQKLTPELGASNNNLGRFVCARGRYEQADKLFIAALADPFYKNPETALVNRAACAMRWGRRDIASESLRRVLQKSPENSIALLQMAQLLFEEGDYMRARAFIERHLSGSPAAPDALLLGFQIESKLKDRRAIDTYRSRLLKEFPESEQAIHMVKAASTP